MEQLRPKFLTCLRDYVLSDLFGAVMRKLAATAFGVGTIPTFSWEETPWNPELRWPSSELTVGKGVSYGFNEGTRITGKSGYFKTELNATFVRALCCQPTDEWNIMFSAPLELEIALFTWSALFYFISILLPILFWILYNIYYIFDFFFFFCCVQTSE